MQICCCLFSSGSEWITLHGFAFAFHLSKVFWLRYFLEGLTTKDSTISFFVIEKSVCYGFLIFPLNVKVLLIHFQGYTIPFRSADFCFVFCFFGFLGKFVFFNLYNLSFMHLLLPSQNTSLYLLKSQYSQDFHSLLSWTLSY